MSDKINQTIATCEEDRVWLKEHAHTIEMLAGMVIEAVNDNPQYLLSPVMRELLVEKAKLVLDQRRAFAGREYLIDNLGDPLKTR